LAAPTNNKWTFQQNRAFVALALGEFMQIFLGSIVVASGVVWLWLVVLFLCVGWLCGTLSPLPKTMNFGVVGVVD
jgi:putative flippase GtrA